MNKQSNGVLVRIYQLRTYHHPATKGRDAWLTHPKLTWTKPIPVRIADTTTSTLVAVGGMRPAPYRGPRNRIGRKWTGRKWQAPIGAASLSLSPTTPVDEDRGPLKDAGQRASFPGQRPPPANVVAELARHRHEIVV